MRVHVVSTSYPRQVVDFSGHFVASSVAELRQAGLDVRVWPVGTGGSLPEALAAAPLRTALRAGRALLAVRARLKAALQPGDVVVTHWLPVGLGLADLAPTLAWAHGGDMALLEALPAGRLLARRMDASARALAFVSDDLRGRFQRLLGRPPRAPHSLLPMGVHPPAPDPVVAAELRRRAGGRPIVATVGRMVAIKGLDVLAQALGHRTDVIWLAGGSGPEAQRLAEISSCFNGLGVLTPAARDALLSVADIFVLPSRPVGKRVEGTPVALLEALCSGVPCIASDTGGVGVIARAAGVVLVPPDEPAALRRAVDDLLANRGAAQRMAAQHRAAAAAYGWAVLGPRHVEAVEALLREG